MDSPKFNRGDRVKILSGKSAGLTGQVLHRASPHHLSSKRRWAVRVFLCYDWRTILVNEDNLELKEG